MFSLNVPLLGRVRQQVEAVRPAESGFETIREAPTLVVKRFGRVSSEAVAGIESEVRLAVAGTEAFEAHLDGIDTFEAPVVGPAPVVYLAVESPGLVALHDRLVAAFDPVEGLEGDDYVPHVTLARGGGSDAAVERLVETEFEPVTWTVHELLFWDARSGESTGRLSLPE